MKSALMKEKIEIALAEDQTLVREAFILMLNSEKSIKVLFDAKDGKELIDQLENNVPDIILLDIEMPVLSGREALKIITQRYPKIKTIILSSHFQRQVIIDFIKMGACAFLPKDCNRLKLIEAINTVQKEGNYFDKEVAVILAKELAAASSERTNKLVVQFSDVELVIIKMICQKKISKEIADALNLSVRTIEWHRSNIMKAIKSKDVNDLILYAVQNNLITII